MARRLDLLVINPGGRSRIYQSLASELSAIEPPVWAGLIANFARHRGNAVELLDANAADMTPESVAAYVEAAAPLLTAVIVYGHNPSASTQVMPAAGDVCRAIKARDPHAAIILAGGHIAALPERTLREEAVDFVCTGEGPYAITDLVVALRDGGVPSTVCGLMYRDGDGVQATPAAPLVQDLDRELAGIAWDLLPMHQYRAHNWHCFGESSRQPYASMYTSLGCPYRCTYCCIQAPFKSGERARGLDPSVNSYRLWSPAVVADELDVLVDRFGVRHLKFADEMFVLNPRHVHGICDAIIERGYALNIWAYARIDTMAPDLPDKLKRAGVSWLCFGIESGASGVRDDVAKTFDQRAITHTIARVRAAGIHVLANYIFGLPADTLETMQQTLDLALELNCEFANFYTAMAYPGSALYQTATDAGWALPSTWSGYSQHARDTRPLPTRHLSARDVLQFRDEAFDKYFRRPEYLSMLHASCGPAAVADVQRMTGHSLQRDPLAVA